MYILNICMYRYPSLVPSGILGKLYILQVLIDQIHLTELFGLRWIMSFEYRFIGLPFPWVEGI